MDFPGGVVVKNPPASARDASLIPGSGRSPEGGNGMDQTEAEDIKKRWQEYTEELYKKDLHDPGITMV